MKIWKIINTINLIAIIVVIVFSREITFYLNKYTIYLNTLENPSDSIHIIRWIMNRWQGITLAGSLALIFFIRAMMRGVSKLTNK